VGYAAGIARYATLLAEALGQSTGPERYQVLTARRGWRQRPGGKAVEQRRCLTPPHHRLERWLLPLELLPRKQPQLLHSLDHVAPAWGPWRSVVTLHDLTFLLYPETQTAASRAYYAASGDSVRHAHRVIAVSQRTASDAVRLLGVDPARVRVVHEAAGPAFGPRPREQLEPLLARLGVPPDKPYILFVGTLEPRKNVPLLIEAFAQIRRQVDASLVLVGARGWLDEPIFAAQARWGASDTTYHTGWLGERDLAVLYSHAGVLALPSLYEGFGLTVLEGMACGAPVICSDAGPLPEVAGDAALLLKPEDASAWAEAIARVLSNKQLSAELRGRGFRRAGEFSWQRTAQGTRDVYREALLA
jgi:glycosyltransferase involved in cell wall biosynthesis